MSNAIMSNSNSQETVKSNSQSDSEKTDRDSDSRNNEFSKSASRKMAPPSPTPPELEEMTSSLPPEDILINGNVVDRVNEASSRNDFTTEKTHRTFSTNSAKSDVFGSNNSNNPYGGDIAAAMAALLQTVDSTITTDRINKLMESKDPTLELLQQHLLTDDSISFNNGLQPLSSQPPSRQVSQSGIFQSTSSTSDFLTNLLKGSSSSGKNGYDDLFRTQDSLLKDLWRTIEKTSSQQEQSQESDDKNLTFNNDTSTNNARNRNDSSLAKFGDTIDKNSKNHNNKHSFLSSIIIPPFNANMLSEESSSMPPPIPSGQTIKQRGPSDSFNALTTPDLFSSRDWMTKYEPGHIEVDVNKVFQSESATKPSGSKPTTAATNTNNSNIKVETDWDALYEEQLRASTNNTAPNKKQDTNNSNSVASFVSKNTNNSRQKASTRTNTLMKEDLEEPTLANNQTSKAKSGSKTRPLHPDSPVADAVKSLMNLAPGNNSNSGVASAVLPASVPSTSVNAASGNTSSSRKRARSTSAGRVYAVVTDADVLLGRGGRTNNHAGNKRYLHEKDQIQERYMSASKQAKTGISQELVDIVHGWGGRFLKLDESNNEWYEVSNTVARKKCSQSLREINTPEERAAKRARYGK